MSAYICTGIGAAVGAERGTLLASMQHLITCTL